MQNKINHNPLKILNQFSTSDNSTDQDDDSICGTKCIPKADDLNVNVIIDKEKSIQLKGSDEDNDLLTYSIVIQPSHGTLTVPDSEGKVSYRPTQGFLGKDITTVLMEKPGFAGFSVIPDPNADYRLKSLHLNSKSTRWTDSTQGQIAWLRWSDLIVLLTLR